MTNNTLPISAIPQLIYKVPFGATDTSTHKLTDIVLSKINLTISPSLIATSKEVLKDSIPKLNQLTCPSSQALFTDEKGAILSQRLLTLISNLDQAPVFENSQGELRRTIFLSKLFGIPGIQDILNEKGACHEKVTELVQTAAQYCMSNARYTPAFKGYHFSYCIPDMGNTALQQLSCQASCLYEPAKTICTDQALTAAKDNWKDFTASVIDYIASQVKETISNPDAVYKFGCQSAAIGSTLAGTAITVWTFHQIQNVRLDQGLLPLAKDVSKIAFGFFAASVLFNFSNQL